MKINKGNVSIHKLELFTTHCHVTGILFYPALVLFQQSKTALTGYSCRKRNLLYPICVASFVSIVLYLILVMLV